MMNCQEARTRLVALADGELAGPDQARVEQHLAACPGCAAEIASLKSDRELLRAEPIPEAPPWLVTRVMAGVAGAARMPVRLTPALAASLVLVTAAGLWLGTALGRGIIPRGPSEEEKCAMAAAVFQPRAAAVGGGR